MVSLKQSHSDPGEQFSFFFLILSELLFLCNILYKLYGEINQESGRKEQSFFSHTPYNTTKIISYLILLKYRRTYIDTYVRNSQYR